MAKESETPAKPMSCKAQKCVVAISGALGAVAGPGVLWLMSSHESNSAFRQHPVWGAIFGVSIGAVAGIYAAGAAIVMNYKSTDNTIDVGDW